MRRNFSLFLARRYLRPKRHAVSVITLICVAGVALGVWIMLVVIAIMSGFTQRTKDMLLKFEAHVFVENRLDKDSPPYPMFGWREVAEKLKGIPDVKAVQPMVEGMVLADANGRRDAQRMRAFPGDDPVVKAETKLKEGTLDLDQGDCAVISHVVARSLEVSVGDTITLYSQGHLDQVLEAFHEAERDPISKAHGETLKGLLGEFDTTARANRRENPEEMAVTVEVAEKLADWMMKVLEAGSLKPSERSILEGSLTLLSTPGKQEPPLAIYPKEAARAMFADLETVANAPVESNNKEALEEIKELVLPKELKITGIFEQPPTPTSPTVFVPLHIGQELYSLGDTVHSIALRGGDPYEAKATAEAVRPFLPEGLTPFPWMERPDLKQYFYALANERRMMYFALFMIMVVAAFCIMVTMITITVEKAKEIGVMKALGAREIQIVNVFLIQGMIVGFIGALCGLGLAGLTIRFRDQIQAFLGHFGMDPFPAATYGLDRIPALLTATDMTYICGGAFLLCSLAALPPAWMVARMDPGRALRKE
ncbi:MAG: FtsX-like permease family protein [Verrucomicrobiales bacterium]